jgi:hypothetical protein
MQFQQEIGRQLEPKHLNPSKLLRQFFKRALVCWLGNFSANLEKRSKTKFLDLRQGQKEEFFDLARREQIQSITPINKNIVQVTLTGARPDSKKRTGEPDDLDNKISRKACAPIGAFITSVARIEMFRHILEITSQRGSVHKICCDALFFSLPPQVACDPLQYSESFGFFKKIYPGELLALAQVGVSNYSVLYQHDGKTVSEAKCSGLKMSHFTTKELNYDVYYRAVNALVHDKLFDSRRYQQVRKKTDTKTVSTGYVRRPRKIFSRNVLSRRPIIKQQDNFVTRPYGYILPTSNTDSC